MKKLLARPTLTAIMALFVVFGSFGGATSARAADNPNAAAQAALSWLLPRQQENGSFPGFDAGASADAILAIAAAGGDPNGIIKNGNSPVSYLGTQASTYAPKSAAGAGKLTLAVIAAGKDPLNFGGQNLIQLILKTYDSKTGRYGVQTTDHAYALLGLASAGQPIPQEAIAAVGALQLPDGGWSFDGAPATGSDTNTTSLVIQALVAANARGEALNKGLAYLKSQQNADGGFPYSKTSQFGSDSDANSTASVIQALVAVGEDPTALKQGGNDPVMALMGFQNPSGALRYQKALPDDNDLATAQAIPAFYRKAFPLKTVSLPAVTAAPANTPATLPATGGTPQPVWLLVPALLLCALGVAMRTRRA